jgi:hypothetical protein
MQEFLRRAALDQSRRMLKGIGRRASRNLAPRAILSKKKRLRGFLFC